MLFLEENKKIITSAPGRICLFGEHQDYLHLPVIAAAIPLRIYCEGKPIDNPIIELSTSLSPEKRIIELSNPEVINSRDYFSSAILVLIKRGYNLNQGARVKIYSQIPIAAGVSSSSALILAWITFLLELNNCEIPSAEQLATFAFEAEVEFFNEPGGMMDQFTCALGHMIYLNPYPSIRVEHLGKLPDGFVLIDPGNKKSDTLSVLKYAKVSRLKLIVKVVKQFEDFNLTTCDEIPAGTNLSTVEQQLMIGTFENKKILEQSYPLLLSPNPHPPTLGELLFRHHLILSEVLNVSTNLIDSGIKECMKMGAYGGKMLGSGVGGCFLIYAPDASKDILVWCEKMGYNAYMLYDEKGVCMHKE